MAMDEKLFPNTTPPETNHTAAQVTQGNDDFHIFFNQDQFRIIKGYKKVNRLLLKHGVYILMFLL